MKLIQTLIRSSLSRRQFQISYGLNNRPFSAMPLSDWGQNQNDDFEQKQSLNFADMLRKNEKFENRTPSPFNFTSGSVLDGLSDTSLNDGVDLNLKEAATFFEFDPEEVTNDDYSFRPDVNLAPRMSYETKDLDLQKPGVRKPLKRREFETTTKEVLKKADFRDVRFLASFITEAGVIIKRSKTGISAKAQRKIAREIKTARAFGLMPFTTMGTKHFVYGNSMEANDQDFGYEAYEHNFVDDEKE